MDFFIWGLFPFLNLICNFHLTAASQDQYWDLRCGLDQYPPESAEESSLEQVLYFLTLPKTNNGFGFYNSNSEPVHAAALCRGDMVSETCQNTHELKQQCGIAIDGAISYEHCLLRYSNHSMGYGQARSRDFRGPVQKRKMGFHGRCIRLPRLQASEFYLFWKTSEISLTSSL